jgi:error-prone DNA polymerase
MDVARLVCLAQLSPVNVMTKPFPFAELHALSHFSFGRGASSAKELFERAKRCGYQALAITDECTFAGAVRALEASRETGIKLIVGTEVTLLDGLKLVLLATNETGYARICSWITQARSAAAKGQYAFDRAWIDETSGVLAIWLANYLDSFETIHTQALWLQQYFPSQHWLGIALHRQDFDAQKKTRLCEIAAQYQLKIVACNDVHMHTRQRRAVQDTLTAICKHRTIAEAGHYLFPNGERHLRQYAALSAIYPKAWLDETLVIANQCQFDLSQLSYRYPRELVPDGFNASTWLRALTEQGCQWRWPGGVPDRAQALIAHELALIADLKFEAFFLTVHDIVRFARSRHILCQGRGSAANSAVCFALGITEIDPARMSTLFERFISKERNEPPDIDVDFEHERREEVFQYIYQKYGRKRAALAATVICYRGKSAVRDVAKALGLPLDQIDQLSRCFSWWENSAAHREKLFERLMERGFDPNNPLLKRVLHVTFELIGAPRHLSQHVGGFVIADQALHHLVPIENAAMPDRTIIQWDKDDLETLGLLKVDCLALGMLSCISKCLHYIEHYYQRKLTPASIPAEDPKTYAMIQRADTVGVFQIESRAQMAMLPRLKPACFYDLVIEVAIVRPGPIQGKMVHPYLRRRQGLETIDYPSEELKAVFERTLGVPLFQEQVMQLAIVAAGFSPGEADQLRRSMAAWQRRGGLEHFRDRLLSGMHERGYPTEFAERVFEQIKGFGSYGFPESHAASFALLTYVSCWLKCHYPAAFTCALINAQPLGFYTPDQLIQDLKHHGHAVFPVDIRTSEWDCTLEVILGKTQTTFALRLGFRVINGFRPETAARIQSARDERPFSSIADLCERAVLDRFDQSVLADSGALKSLSGHRHRTRWAIEGIHPTQTTKAKRASATESQQMPLFTHLPAENKAQLPLPSVANDVYADYASLGLSLGKHPVALIRARLHSLRCVRSNRLANYYNYQTIRVAGLVTVRQRPATASGVTFVSLEDEDGTMNIVVWKKTAEDYRRTLLESQLLIVDGRVECAQGVTHIIAKTLTDASHYLPDLDLPARNFR